MNIIMGNIIPYRGEPDILYWYDEPILWLNENELWMIVVGYPEEKNVYTAIELTDDKTKLIRDCDDLLKGNFLRDIYLDSEKIYVITSSRDYIIEKVETCNPTEVDKMDYLPSHQE